MELFFDFLHEITCGDKALENFLQMIAGMSALGKVYSENLIIAHGCGRNGKSTFFNLLSKVMGDYSGNLSAETLTANCRKNKSPEYAELRGKRLVIASELEENMQLNTAIVKKLCSTDDVYAEKKYKDPFKYTPTHTLVLYTNHLPRVGANDDGTWRRLIVIPFNAKIRGKSDIKNYADYLVRNAGGAILMWIIEGAQKAIKNKFTLTIPQVVQEAIAQYRINNDWLSIFLEDCCEIDRTYTQKSGEFYQEYRAYCLRNGEYARSTTDFYTGLEKVGFTRKKTRAGMVISGLRLKSDFLD